MVQTTGDVSVIFYAICMLYESISKILIGKLIGQSAILVSWSDR
jgi:hypothetical protein